MESRAIVYTFESETNEEFYEKKSFVHETYQKRIHYYFDMEVLDGEKIRYFKVILTQNAAMRGGKKPSGSLAAGLGQLRKKASKVELMQLDDISDVEWAKESEKEVANDDSSVD